MNKSELIELVAKKVKLPKTQSESVLNATLEVIQNAVSKGEEVKIVGFGTFDRTLRKSRNGRNPKTGKTLVIPETEVPRFRPGKDFKEKLKTKARPG